MPETEAEKKERIDLTRQVEAIAEITRRWQKLYKGFFHVGHEQCPLCGAKMVIQHKTNGHVWGRCSTVDCLNWMQ